METRYEEEGLKERTREIEKSIIKRFRKEIWRPFVKALNEYEMIQEGDQIAVCISVSNTWTGIPRILAFSWISFRFSSR